MTENNSQTHDKDWFWKIFGGAIVGAITLLVITMFGYFQSSLSELRQEVYNVNTRIVEMASKELGEIKKSIIITEKNIDLLITRDLVQIKEKLASLDANDKQQTKDSESALNKSTKAEEAIVAIKEDLKKIEEQIQQIREKLASINVDTKN